MHMGMAYNIEVLTKTPAFNRMMEAVTKNNSGNKARNSFSNKKTLKLGLLWTAVECKVLSPYRCVHNMIVVQPVLSKSRC